ncbi:MAG: endonuclease III [Bacteroidales bacterium]|nr:endonuclease III [Bacteroidales bacterium]
MKLNERYGVILSLLQDLHPTAQSELNFSNPYELIVSVILSAQCTDRRVNLTTPALFAKFPTVRHLAEASFEEVFELIHSISYPNNKARHIIAMAQRVVSGFGGEIPTGIDDLMSLPGVGRKTANVVASIIDSAPVIAVDTHVFRVAHRLGLSKGTTPRAVELDLERHIPAEMRPDAHHWLLLHGRYTCTAKKPQCEHCGLKPYCKSAV